MKAVRNITKELIALWDMAVVKQQGKDQSHSSPSPSDLRWSDQECLDALPPDCSEAFQMLDVLP